MKSIGRLRNQSRCFPEPDRSLPAGAEEPATVCPTTSVEDRASRVAAGRVAARAGTRATPQLLKG